MATTLDTTTTTTTTTLPPPPPVGAAAPPVSDEEDSITIDDLPYIDLNSFTQSELLSLSRTSKSYFNPSPDSDLVLPQINRAVFNESAGSRRQTYSRVRLRNPHHRTHRLPRNSNNPLSSPPDSDPQNHAILHYLKHFLHHGPDSSPPPPPPITLTPPLHPLGFGLEKVNAKGEVVDFEVLGRTGDGVFEAELRRRSEGLASEEEVLGVLTGFEGQWCSRRKRRKYVDASQFGEVLPVGWKLLLGLRRRDGSVTVYCRRFVSPNGQQFVSCKEAALFLQSHFALNNGRQPVDQRGFSMPQVFDFTSTSNIGSLAGDVVYEKIPVSTLPVSDLHQSLASFGEMDNFAEVQVHDLFECYKCNLSFDEKDAYLQHLFSFHGQASKRIKSGRPVGEGVIIRDGKFECQFCHKVFEERRKYNGHVGVHVRNKETGDLDVVVAAIKNNKSFSHEELVLHNTTVSASLELDFSTTLEKTDGTADNLCPSTVNSIQDLTFVTDQQLNLRSDHCEQNQPTEDPNLNQHGIEGSQEKVEAMNIDDGKGILDKNCAIRAPNDLESLSGEQNVGFEVYEAKSNNISGLIAQTDVPHNEIASSSEYFMQSLECFPEFASDSNKGESEYFNVDTKLQNVTGFEELGLDDLEPFDTANGSVMEEELSSVRFNPEEMNMDGGLQLTTLCVWCRSEFKLEHIDPEAQSDTIGYMCPSCKDKISGLS